MAQYPIYERLCQKYSLLPEECLFADDRMENVEAARKFGMQAICFEDAVQYEQELRKTIEILSGSPSDGKLLS